ncbi:tetratricopeptide repeat protein [Streptomyces sp. NPDC001852]|uniref:nucleotide-binding protein n=1 Tax=Streptomyces sp. NPDC001852 TaxID=3364619 RepID=UPI0036AB2C2B
MQDDALLLLAEEAAAALVGAAGGETWPAVRAWTARLLGDGDPQCAEAQLERLDRTLAALRGAPDDERLRTRAEVAWQTRFEDLLEDAERCGRQGQLAERLRRLVSLAARTSVLAQPPGAPPARLTEPGLSVAPPPAGLAPPAVPLPPPGPPSAAPPAPPVPPLILVGSAPSVTHPFQSRPETDALGALFDAPPAPWALVGGTGVGKTQLAAHLVRRVQQERSADLLVWVTAASRNAVVCDFAAAGVAVAGADPGQPEHAAQTFLAWLRATERRWLVVLDGLADPSDLHGLWPPERPGGRTLVTARPGVPLPLGSIRIPVGPFTRDAAMLWLAHDLALRDRYVQLTEVDAVATGLGYLPLALSRAAAWMVESGLGCADYRERLAERAGSGGDPLTACWWLSIEEADRRCGGLARPMLELAALLDPYGVPVAALTSRPALAQLARRRTPGAASGAEPAGVPDAVDTLDALRRLRLVECEGEAPYTTVRVSGALQDVVRAAVPPEEYGTLVAAAADALGAAWRTTSAAQPGSALCRALRAGTAALAELGGEALWRDQCHPVFFQAGRNLLAAGFVHAAKAFWERLHATLNSRFGAGHPDTLAARGRLAAAYGASGDAAGAVTVYRELLSDLVREFGADHLSVLTVRDNLARWQGEAGDRAGAAASYAALLEDRLRVLGPGHHDTLLTRHNVALWRGLAGDAAGAADAYGDLLDDMVRVWGPDSPAVLGTRDQLAQWRSRAAEATVAGGSWPLPPEAVPPAPAAAPADRGEGTGAPHRIAPADDAGLSSARLVRELPWLRRLLRRAVGKGRPATARARAADDLLRAPVTGCHRIAVISLKGGTGKTTTAAVLGATLAGVRGGGVVALGAAPDGGTLGTRVRREPGAEQDRGPTVRDLLAALPSLRHPGDVRRFTSPGPNGLDILAGAAGPVLTTPFGPERYRQVVAALCRTYPIVVTDAGTGLLHDVMRGVLDLADQLVVVTTPTVEGADVADRTLEWLADHGHAKAARRAVVVLSGVQDASRVRRDRIVSHFAHRCRGVVQVPFDEHLATGAELDLASLHPQTRRAYDDLALLVAAGFAREPRPAAPAGPRPALRPRVTVPDDVPRVGTPTAVEFRLEPVGPAAAAVALDVRVVAAPRSAAVLEPPVLDHTAGSAPAVFSFTAHRPGEHRLRFTVYDAFHGKVLQTLEAGLTVPAPEPAGRR